MKLTCDEPRGLKLFVFYDQSENVQINSGLRIDDSWSNYFRRFSSPFPCCSKKNKKNKPDRRLHSVRGWRPKGRDARKDRSFYGLSRRLQVTVRSVSK